MDYVLLKENIKNIKYSIKILNLDWLKTINNLKDKTLHNNYVVFKDKYVFILFKPNKQKNNETHLNVTKINNSKDLIDSYSKICKNIHGQIMLNTLKIDNCTILYSHYKNISLKDLYQNKNLLLNSYCKVFYNKDKFPGIFYKTNYGTAIIFHTGKIVFVGIKEINNAEKILNNILQEIK